MFFGGNRFMPNYCVYLNRKSISPLIRIVSVSIATIKKQGSVFLSRHLECVNTLLYTSQKCQVHFKNLAAMVRHILKILRQWSDTL